LSVCLSLVTTPTFFPCAVYSPWDLLAQTQPCLSQLCSMPQDTDPRGLQGPGAPGRVQLAEGTSRGWRRRRSGFPPTLPSGSFSAKAVFVHDYLLPCHNVLHSSAFMEPHNTISSPKPQAPAAVRASDQCWTLGLTISRCFPLVPL
jgi:hypothetical protein